ncbi:MAG: DUF805 domain-containing protein [Lentilactobacillus diolivorans]|jgi:uncharacterized membrane protein YhaH (DUF805 family)|nr:DUF805 domain-containing protein [Lentilactobacillus diolivorans]RRG03211.1 MAG: DUF805 domain-containing protein [Lactobacillus sp.]
MDQATKFCPNCGSQMPRSSKFCPKCGFKQPPLSDEKVQPQANDQGQINQKDTTGEGLASDPDPTQGMFTSQTASAGSNQSQITPQDQYSRVNANENQLAPGFINSFKLLLRDAFMINHRMSRADFWWAMLPTALIFTVLEILICTIAVDKPLALYSLNDDVQRPILFGIILVSSAIFSLLWVACFTANIRRLHDTNRSGWNYCWSFFPIAGGVVLLVFLCSKGTSMNRFPMSSSNILWVKKWYSWPILVVLFLWTGVSLSTANQHLIRSEYGTSTNYAFGFTGSQAARDIEQKVTDEDSDDYDSPSVRWDNSRGETAIHLSDNSRVMQGLNDSEVAIWKSLVRSATNESAWLAKNKGKRYSRIVVPNPDDSDRIFLDVYNGQVEYNTSDDM